jgi:hypothetical protein
MDLREIGWRGCRMDPVGSGGSCKYSDEPAGSGTTELVNECKEK